MIITKLIRALTSNCNVTRIHPMNTTEKPQIEKIEPAKKKDPCASIYDRHRKPGAYDDYKNTLILPKTA